MSCYISKKTSTCGSQVGHMWVTSRLFCRSVGQMSKQVQPTFNPDMYHNTYVLLEYPFAFLLFSFVFPFTLPAFLILSFCFLFTFFVVFLYYYLYYYCYYYYYYYYYYIITSKQSLLYYYYGKYTQFTIA